MRLIPLPLLLATVLLATPAAAKDKPERREGVRSERSLSESVREVERSTGGRVVEARRIRDSGREIDRVKVVTPEGRVRVIHHETQPRERRERRARED